MKIISPVDHLDEAAALLAAGATELYGGYLPPGWDAYRLLASINQRTFAGAQISSRAELAEVVRTVHERNGRFSVTLNAPYYVDAQLPLLLDYVADLQRLGVDGIILADLGLLRTLRQHFPDFEYHASTLAHLSSAAAVSFYRQQGCSRVVLQRHLDVATMERIIAQVPGVVFDAFLLVGKCPNTEGLCSFHHSSPDKIWPCEIPYRIEAQQASASPALRSAMERQQSWSSSNRRHGCGLCAIPHLERIGISGLKLVGRGAPTAQKLANIELVRGFLQLSREQGNPKVYRRLARQAYRQRFGHPCSPNVCYYPEFYEAE